MWQVTLLSVLLVVLLALSLRTLHTITSKGLPPRYSALARRYFELEQVNKDSEKQIIKLRDDVTKLENAVKASAQSDSGRLQVNVLHKQLQEMKTLAGLTPMAGPGVEVILNDSPKAKEFAKQLSGGTDQGASFQDQLSNFMVHDQDIVGVVNELKQAGAEAIAVNGQRVIATTAIRCVGPVVFINGKASGGAAPYTITAIGSARDLEGGLKLPGGYLDQQQLLAYNMVTIKRRDRLEIPAYDGPTMYDYAKPVAEAPTAGKTALNAPEAPALTAAEKPALTAGPTAQ
ncbi:MAG: DUF881 domain-containing protein [Armatimonadetes bacterium]|nr:DUF881 domain-containing protein [Armatimonadota bacterium]